MLMIMLCMIMILFVLIYGFCSLFGNKDLYRKSAHIPGPLSFPVAGCAHLFLGNSEYALKKTLRLTKKYTSPVRIPIGSRVYVVTVNPDQIKTILCSNKIFKENKFNHKFLEVLGGKGLLTAEYKLWRVHRKLIQPAFASKVVESFFSIFQKNSIILTRRVENQIGCSEIELADHIAYAFLCNISESSLGVSIKEQRTEIENFLKVTQRAFELLFERIIRPWLYADKTFEWSKIGKETYECRDVMYAFSQNVIKDMRQSLQNSPIKNEEVSVRKRNSTLNLLLETSYDEKKLTVEEIRDHIVTFIVAGYDTTARTINFILLMLALHPDVQDKVYEEIFNLYGDEDVESNPIKYEDLQHLKYLERVIKETMRLFPVGSLILRELTEDFELDGHLVPAGCALAIFTLGLHRDEKIWPNPLKFDPDRFLPEVASERHPFAFIPFSSGPKDCIGRLYAMVSIKVFVATFLRKYIVKKDKITPVKDIRLKMDLLLQTVEPITLRLENRNK